MLNTKIIYYLELVPGLVWIFHYFSDAMGKMVVNFKEPFFWNDLWKNCLELMVKNMNCEKNEWVWV